MAVSNTDNRKATKATGRKSTAKKEDTMAPRPKTTITRVAVALEKLQSVRDELHEIDLRTTRGTLRDEIREARVSVDTALVACSTALQADAESLASGRRAS